VRCLECSVQVSLAVVEGACARLLEATRYKPR
jgi:hypothetical protein